MIILESRINNQRHIFHTEHSYPRLKDNRVNIR
jgi:hypothetical protein